VAFEIDVLAGFVLAPTVGLADSTISSDVMHLGR